MECAADLRRTASITSTPGLMIDFHGRLALSGTIRPHALTFPMPLTQVQLADHIGITAIHLNRVLRTFREKEILLLRDGEVSVIDLPRLASLAAPLLDPYEHSRPEYGGSQTTAS